MPNLEFELRRLTAADKYIEDAEERIAHMRARTQREKALGVDVSSVETALQAVADRLQVFLHHRRTIEQTIEEIRSGTSRV